MIFYKLFTKRAIQTKAQMFTWENFTKFDSFITPLELENSFKQEFPLTVARNCDICIWQMFSFNSSEGKCNRYLVAINCEKNTECSKRKFRKRKLPMQIFLYEIADKIMKSGEFNLSKLQNYNNGNFLFYCVHESILYIIVFFEGRLCHWSEEFSEKFLDGILKDRCKNAVYERLQRFRKFLSADSLFCKGAPFCEIDISTETLDAKKNLIAFKRTSKDSFWRKLDLQSDSIYSKNTKKNAQFSSNIFYIKILVLCALAIFLMIVMRSNKEADILCENCIDAKPVELSTYEFIAENTEIVKQKSFEKKSQKKDSLKVDFLLKGIVANKLAVVQEISNCNYSSCNKTVAVDDSIANCIVKFIGKDFITIDCAGVILKKEISSAKGQFNVAM